MTGRIVDIKRFAIHDGPGIRTTLFLKGCPLRCIWCHNPETIEAEPELAYIEKKCVNCAECVRICPVNAHYIDGGKHIYIRGRCIACGRCADVCLGKALVFYGNEVQASEMLPLLMEDRDFYIQSGGGITLSGGEPLLQPKFCAEVLGMIKEERVGTAIDTCGAVQWEAFEKVLPLTDLFLFDVKVMDPIKHNKFSGKDNSLILDNLRRLSNGGASIEIRIPLIPGYNDDDTDIDWIGEFLGSLTDIQAVKILPYNNLARSKYISLDKQDTMPCVEPPSNDRLHQVVARLHSFGLNVLGG